jgi:hypothetical protein
MKKNCKLCKKEFTGRSDKIFCSLSCKSNYNGKLSKATLLASQKIDNILHRNRSILLEIIGKSIVQKKVDRSLLDSKKFNWHYVTNYHLNSQNKTVNFVYDFSWIIFSDQEVLIKRIRPLAD